LLVDRVILPTTAWMALVLPLPHTVARYYYYRKFKTCQSGRFSIIWYHIISACTIIVCRQIRGQTDRHMNLLKQTQTDFVHWIIKSRHRSFHLPSPIPHSPTYRRGQICVIILNSDKHSKNYTCVCDRLLFLSPLVAYILSSSSSSSCLLRVRCIPFSLVLKVELVPPSLLRSSNVPSSFWSVFQCLSWQSICVHPLYVL